VLRTAAVQKAIRKSNLCFTALSRDYCLQPKEISKT